MSTTATVWAWKQQVGNPVRKLVLLHLADAASIENDWHSWYSLSRIAERCDCSRGAVRNHLRSLIDLGYIALVEQSTRQGKAARYRLNVGTVEIQTLPKPVEAGASDEQPGTAGEQGGTPDEQLGGASDEQPGTSRAQPGTPDVPKTKGTSNQPKEPSFSIVEKLKTAYGYDPAKFGVKENAIISRWELEGVTEDEIEHAHEIGYKSIGKLPALQYMRGVIRNRRKQAPQSDVTPHRQIESTDPLAGNTEEYESRHAQRLLDMIEDGKQNNAQP